MIAPNYHLNLQGMQMLTKQDIEGKHTKVRLTSYMDKNTSKEQLQGEVGGTKFNASSELNDGMEFRTYDRTGECKSQVFYNKDGAITSIVAFNEDGDTLYMSPSAIKYDSKKEIGLIAKLGNLHHSRVINVNA